MAGKYDQLHIMINHPTEYESYETNDRRGDAFTKWSRTDEQTNIRTNGQIEKLHMGHKNKCYMFSSFLKSMTR